MLVRKNLIFSLIFDMQYYYAVDLQTDNKGTMTAPILVTWMHVKTRAVNPPHLQILRIDGGGMIVIMHTSHDVIWEKKQAKKMLLEL